MDVLLFGFCGLLFGTYMVLMSKSAVTGAITFFVLSVITLVGSAIFLVWQKPNMEITGTQMQLMVAASLLNVVGAMVLFTGLAKASPARAGTLIVTMVIVQMTTATLLAAVLSKTSLSGSKITGVVLAAAAVFLMSR